MPERSQSSPTLDLQLTWRGSVGRLRVYPDHHIEAETSYERDAVERVPMDAVTGWRLEPCDFDAVCVEFPVGDDVYRVLLDTTDAAVARMALQRALGDPIDSDSEDLEDA